MRFSLFFKIIAHMWDHLPALYYGLSFLIGFSLAYHFSWILLLPFILLFLPLFFNEVTEYRLFFNSRSLLALTVVLSGYIEGKLNYVFPKIQQEGISGTAKLSIDSVSLAKSPFGSAWKYTGKIEGFLPDESDKSIKNLPFQMLLSHKIDVRAPANCDYCVRGMLKESDGNYVLKVKSNAEWEQIPRTFSLAEKRFEAKERVRRYIEKHYTSQKSTVFLSALTTGEFNDKLMAAELSRFGLQHIMAISGFHYSLLAGFLAFGLRIFCRQTTTSCLLIIALSSYFLFLGPGPSILRAWLTIVLYHCGMLFEQRTVGLNTLGIALIACLIIDPLMVKSLGFQFSFLATAAILLFFTPCDFFLQSFLKKRSLSLSSRMSGFSQHGLVLAWFLRQAIALTLAVNVVAFPLTLFYFHKFPLLGLAYNLFFPFMVSVTMLLFLLGFIGGSLFSFLGSGIHSLNNAYTHLVLNMTYNIPMAIDYYIWDTSLTGTILIGYFSILFFSGIAYRSYLLQRQVECRDLMI